MFLHIRSSSTSHNHFFLSLPIILNWEIHPSPYPHVPTSQAIIQTFLSGSAYNSKLRKPSVSIPSSSYISDHHTTISFWVCVNSKLRNTSVSIRSYSYNSDHRHVIQPSLSGSAYNSKRRKTSVSIPSCSYISDHHIPISFCVCLQF